MRARWVAVAIMAISIIGPFVSNANAQGGWRQWDIYLRDGSKIEANPLSSTDDNHVSHSLKNDASPGQGIERSKIDYIAAQGNGLPEPPSGPSDQDLVIMRDGRRSAGHITLKAISFSEGVISQNGTNISLEDVAYIKFADPPRKSGGTKGARAKVASPILVKGEPALTQATVNQIRQVFEWILNGKFTAKQRKQLQRIMVSGWQRNDRQLIESLMTFEPLHEQLANATRQEREALRSKLQPDVLKSLREPPVDEISLLLLSVYEAGKRK